VIVPLTSRLSAIRFAGSFTVSPTEANGLACESVVLTHQVRAIDRNRIEKTIGKLVVAQMDRLETELRSLLGL
jgi:mRNA-degrading endonuclease toxin of MazEF toxin-antitoxin module